MSRLIYCLKLNSRAAQSREAGGYSQKSAQVELFGATFCPLSNAPTPMRRFLEPCRFCGTIKSCLALLGSGMNVKYIALHTQ